MLEVKAIAAPETYALRHSILRPHQRLEQCVYPGDQELSTRHFGALMDNELVGILSIYRQNHADIKQQNAWQLRAMATSEKIRGHGVGRLLINAAEAYAKERGGQCIWANARLEALGFYEKAGYCCMGNEFMIHDIGPHYLIYKTIAAVYSQLGE